VRKPFKAGRWTLSLGDYVPERWALAAGSGGVPIADVLSDADIRHIKRLCAKAMKYRHKSKARRVSQVLLVGAMLAPRSRAMSGCAFPGCDKRPGEHVVRGHADRDDRSMRYHAYVAPAPQPEPPRCHYRYQAGGDCRLDKDEHTAGISHDWQTEPAHTGGGGCRARLAGPHPEVLQLRAANAALTTEVAGLRERLGEAEGLLRGIGVWDEEGPQTTGDDIRAFLAAGAK
jgi:hypothetical protein